MKPLFRAVAAATLFSVWVHAQPSVQSFLAELNRALGTNLEPDYFTNPYGFTQDHTECDMTKARDGLGHVPQFDLRKGIEAYAASGKLA